MLDGQQGAFDADRRFHDLAKGQEPPLEHLQQRPDAEHEPAYLVRRGFARRQDGLILTKGPIEIVRPNEPFGAHVFVLVAPHANGRSASWHTIRHGSGSNSGSGASADELIGRVQSDPALAKKVSDLMHPGLVLVMTDAPLHPRTRSIRNFIVMAQDTTGSTPPIASVAVPY